VPSLQQPVYPSSPPPRDLLTALLRPYDPRQPQLRLAVHIVLKATQPNEETHQLLRPSEIPLAVPTPRTFPPIPPNTHLPPAPPPPCDACPDKSTPPWLLWTSPPPSHPTLRIFTPLPEPASRLQAAPPLRLPHTACKIPPQSPPPRILTRRHFGLTTHTGVTHAQTTPSSPRPTRDRDKPTVRSSTCHLAVPAPQSSAPHVRAYRPPRQQTPTPPPVHHHPARPSPFVPPQFTTLHPQSRLYAPHIPGPFPISAASQPSGRTPRTPVLFHRDTHTTLTFVERDTLFLICPPCRMNLAIPPSPPHHHPADGGEPPATNTYSPHDFVPASRTVAT